MKTSKKIISMLLCVVMIASTFCGLGLVLDDFVAEAADTFEPNITIGGITQKRVVDNYKATYEAYQQKFVNGRQTNEPTNFVIPGLSEDNDYIPQGLTYWKAKDWFLISAYDRAGSKASVIYALDGATAEFVALFRIHKSDGTINKSHGGGIAASEYNFYYADTEDGGDNGSNISYIPLSELDVEKGTAKDIYLRGTINLSGELKGASTSYCCYDDGILWAGNFYHAKESDYDTVAISDSYPSILLGYNLYGNSSEEEWYYLSTNYNLLKPTVLDTATTTSAGTGSMTYTTSYSADGSSLVVVGNATASAYTFELSTNVATVNLTEGKTYRLSFDTNTKIDGTDFYLISSASKHLNSYWTKATQLANGNYHYEMIFTAGLVPPQAAANNTKDTNWPATQSTDGSFTGTYNLRFDQNEILAGESRDFQVNNLKLVEYVAPNGFTPNSRYEGVSCEGNPAYVITFENKVDKIQYAIVDKGKIYLSRSWGRKASAEHIREISVAEIDINVPGSMPVEINGRNRSVTVVNYKDSLSIFGGSGNNADDDNSQAQKMLYMSEGIVVVEDYLYVFGESAAWKYNGGESNTCPKPIDVIWKFDHHEMMGEDRTHDDTTAEYYEKVENISELKASDDYIIVHESPVKDPLTQKNLIYALDSYGGYGDKRLPKQDSLSQASTGDSMGLVGYEIKNYEIETTSDGKTRLYLNAEDDAYKSIRWQIVGAGSSTLRINNKELYYATNKHFYLGSRLFAMSSTNNKNLDNVKLEQYNGEAGNFRIYYNGVDADYYLWCNDGSNQQYIDAYTNYYSDVHKEAYTLAYTACDEIPGTFHGDANYAKNSLVDSGNITAAPVGADMQIINIYKRVSDPYSSAYESKVYSDLRAELQADGTYNIILETYADSPLQYQTVGTPRPTDFIFLLDGSSSMATADAAGFQSYPATEPIIAGELNYKNDDFKVDKNTSKYDLRNSELFFRTEDGNYHPIYLSWHCYDRNGWAGTRSIRFYVYYIDESTSLRYMIQNNIASKTGLTEAQLKSYVENNTDYVENNITYTKSKVGKSDDLANFIVYTGSQYKYKNGDLSRLIAMQNAMTDLTKKIAADAAASGLDHRIAVTTFGSNSDESWLNTNLYTNESTSAISYPNTTDDNYKNAFYNTNSFEQVRTIVNNIVVSTGDKNYDPDTYSNYGFEMANKIIDNSDATYDVNGERSVCIVMITDGVPGLGGDKSAEANRVANLAIAQTYISKTKGAYVYSIQMGNNSMSGFNMDDYMNYTSSEFLYAKSLSEPGDRNIKDVKYRIDVPTGSSFNLDYIVNGVFDSITSNSSYAAATLTAESILREQISDAFVIPADATVKTETAEAHYDQLNRLSFNAPVTATGITTNVNKEAREIKVTGYDYSKYYVTKSNEGNGKKLIVTISGVLANMEAELNNTSINEHEKTGIYENQTRLTENNPVKQFPTEAFSVPEYNFIMDYDLPMLDTEVNGTLKAVDSEIRRQNPANYNEVLDGENIKIAFTNSNQDLVYTLKQDEDRGYVLIQRDDGTYEWFRINIIPASNVYYEESRLTPVAMQSQTYCAWSSTNATSTGYQDTSTDSDVYGYDKYYNNTNNYSNGSYMTAVVNASTNRTETQSFTFTGKGFDLVSACGPETGMLLVTIKNGETIEKIILVDTYYSDATYGLLTQVPVLHYVTEDYATRTVEITGVYLKDIYEPKDQTEAASLDAEVDMSVPAEEIGMFAALGMPELDDMDIDAVWMDENSVLNPESQIMTTADGASTPVSRAGNKTVYLDGYRVYNTLKDDSRYIASEQNATYYNVEDELKNGKFEDDAFDTFVAYVEGGSERKDINFGNYTKNGIGGPAGEVYLEPNTAISFKLAATSISRAAIAPSVMVGMRNVSGAPKAKIKDAELDITSKTEMYYDVSTLIDGTSTNGTTVYTVTVTNTGTGILAVNNIKLTNAELVSTSAADLPTVSNLMMMSATPVEVSTLNTRGYANQHPDYVPEKAGTTNPDPDLDPVSRPGDTKVDFGNIGDLIDTGSVTPASFLAAILDIFKKLFANLGKLLFSI